MKIIIVGGTGTIGKAVANELGKRHELVIAAHKSGDVQVDITSIDSIKKMYQRVGKFDALIATVGQVCFEDFIHMDAEKYFFGLNHKLMGQVNLVIEGREHINDHGSFTLTSGCLSEDPIKAGSSAAMVNGALNSFAIAAAIEMPRDLRINVISPTILLESQDVYDDFFRGFLPVSAAHVALAYSKSVEGKQTGKIYRVGY